MKLLVNLFILFLIIIMANCGMRNEENEHETRDTVCTTNQVINPNGDSELGLLMRDMFDTVANLSSLIADNKLPGKFPEKFLGIHSATSIDDKVNSIEYKTLATDYINNLKQLYEGPKSDVKRNFNIMVQGCISCHQSFCPGPIKKINKIKLKI